MSKRTRSTSTLNLTSPPAPLPISPPPSAAYTVDKWQRVIRADFTGREISPRDEEYLLGLFEDADTTVIIKGLASRLEAHKWTW